MQITMSSPSAVMADGDDFIKSRIYSIRGVQVILSSDLASLYDVEVKYLHRQVKRNAKRFPADFVLHISPDEANDLRCQNVTSKRGGDRYGFWLLRNRVSLCYLENGRNVHTVNHAKDLTRLTF